MLHDTVILSPYLFFTLSKCDCAFLNRLSCFSNPHTIALLLLKSLYHFLDPKLVPACDITVSLLIGL